MRAINERTVIEKLQLGNIPEDWSIVELGELGKTLNGLTYSPKDISEKGTLVLRSSNVQNRKLSFEDNVYVNVAEGDFNPIRHNDILLCVRNGSKALIGKSALIDDKNEGYAFGAFMAVFRGNKNEFLFHLFDSDIFHRQVHRNLGATINSINASNLKKFIIPLPPANERRIIATQLSDWDYAINKTSDLIKKLKKRKSGLMQQLLSGKTRLPSFIDKWHEIEIGELLKYTPRPKEKPKKNFLALGLRSHGKGIFHKEDFNPSSISMDTLYEVKEHDLIVNITFAWEHAIAVASKNDEGGLVSHRFPTYSFRENRAHYGFFKYLVLQPRFKYQLGVISPGGAGRNRVMSKKDFLKLKVNVPSYIEQKAIGNLLQNVDKELNYYEDYLIKITSQKKGLMQRLLKGKIRVKMDKIVNL